MIQQTNQVSGYFMNTKIPLDHPIMNEICCLNPTTKSQFVYKLQFFGF